MTYDHSMEQTLPSEWSEWDPVANTVTFHIPRSYLAGATVTAPYDVFGLSGYTANNKFTVVKDDRAPDAGSIGVAAPAGTTSGTLRRRHVLRLRRLGRGQHPGHDRARAARGQQLHGPGQLARD